MKRGDISAVKYAIEKIAKQEGFGGYFRKGVAAGARSINIGADKYAMQIKGLELFPVEMRIFKSVALLASIGKAEQLSVIDYYGADNSATWHGRIDVTGKGFRGGARAGGTTSCAQAGGEQGESIDGTGQVGDPSPNDGGGGGGGPDACADCDVDSPGGGGGYGTAGTAGINPGDPTTAGQGGSAYGVPELETQLYHGSGGGESHYPGNPGGDGGGALMIFTPLLDLSGVARGVLILQCSMPAAVFNYLFAQRYARAPEEVASIVVVSTLLGFAGLPLLLGFLL